MPSPPPSSQALEVLPRALAQREELGIEDVIAQVQKIQAVMERVMREGEHYGTIPGTNKPTLLKPGAEKLLLTFRFDPQYESAETYDGKHLTVKSRCTLYHITSQQRMGSGEGSCSTKESKYAYRQGKRLCPKCGADAILRSKYPPKNNRDAEPGWYCFAKRGGCGEEFLADDSSITSQTTARVANEDLADQYNTVLKMANKRSLVAAVLNVTAASDIFTQDLEDNGDVGGRGDTVTERGNTGGNTASVPRQPQSSAKVSAADHSKGDLETAPLSEHRHAPTDPDDPSLIAQSESLFPSPDADRDPLITRIRKFPDARRKVIMKRVMDLDPETDLQKLDLSALAMLAQHLEAK